MKRFNKTNRTAPRLGIETLEARALMTGIVFDSVSGVLTIHGSKQDDVAKVAIVNNKVKVDLTSYADVEPHLSFFSDSKSFSPASVKLIKFFGNDGDDQFVCTSAINIKTDADGGYGNDTLSGGKANDRLVGNYGDDWIWGNLGNDELSGSGGHDLLDGGAGHDLLKGHGGKDSLFGGSGNDALYGGSDTDLLNGESGCDTIVAIGGGLDTVTGGQHTDYLWLDTTDVLKDASAYELTNKYVHKVNQFYSYTFDGGLTNTAVSKELEGQNLLDPKADDGILFSSNFAANPLFATTGPTADDIFQGQVGDCYFMARLSSVADQNPEIIKNMVVPLGDGTYAVRFFRNNQAEYVRVDADLYVNPLTNTPLYAKLGSDSSLWVPVVEKAYAFWRKNQGSYPSINGGNGGFQSTSADLGVTHEEKAQAETVTPQQVIDWVNGGRANGTTKNKIQAAVTDLLKWMRTELTNGNAVIIGSRSGLSNTLALQVDAANTEANESTWRRSQHIFMVDRVLSDASGNPTGVVVRNPYGTQGPNGDGYLTITDFSRIYFCIGGAVSLQV